MMMSMISVLCECQAEEPSPGHHGVQGCENF
jgi:hypothetical protein